MTCIYRYLEIMNNYPIVWPTFDEVEVALPQGLNCPFPWNKPPNVAPWNGDRANLWPIKKFNEFYNILYKKK